MAFLFKGRKHQQGAAAASAAATPTQSKESPTGFDSSISGANAASGPGREKEREQGRNQTPTPGSSMNNSMNSLGGNNTPSPEQKGFRDKADMESQAPRRPPNINNPFPSNNANALLYPWSQRRLNFTTPQQNPFPRYGAAVNSVSSKDGEIYLMGGLINGTTVKGDLWLAEADGSSLACYPIVPKSEGPGPRVGHAALIVGNAFIVFGGDTEMDNRDILDDTLYLLNTSTRQWSRAVPGGSRPSGRYGHTLNIIGSKIYIFGGQVEGYFFNDLVAFDLNTLQSPGNRWEVLIPNNNDGGISSGRMPAARTNHTTISWNDKLYLFGGTNGLQWFNDVWAYDPRSNVWTQLDCIGYIPAPREGHAAAIVGDVMYIFGGRTEDANDLGDLAAFRISSRRWYTFQNMGPSPSPRSGHSMTSYGKQVVVLGGAPSSALRDPQELSLVYLLDTDKIRYPNDQSQPGPAGERATGTRRPSGGEKSGIPQSRGPPGRDIPAIEGKDPKRPPGAPRESVTPPTNPFNRGPESGPTGPFQNSGSRLPRASMSHAPSGPPPQQSAPPPRVNGVVQGVPGGRSKTPTRNEQGYGPCIDTTKVGPPAPDKEAGSPVTRDSPSIVAPAVNGRRTPTQQGKPAMKPKDAGDSSILGHQPRSRSRQARQQGSVDSTNENSGKSITESSPAIGNTERNWGGGQAGNQSFEREAKGPSQQQHEALLQELDEIKSKNAWYASEMALARKAGYSPNMPKSSPLEEQSSDTFGEDDRPLVEALLMMRAELAKIQSSIDTQAAHAAQQIADVERQRDVAVSEAVYAKAKLAAHGGSQAGTPQPDSRSREVTGMDADRSTGLNRKLASALELQGDLQSKLTTLNREVENERRARSLSEETSQTAQARVTELDTYRQQSSVELDRLRAELHEIQKQARDEGFKSAEAVASSKMLRADNADLRTKLEDALSTTKTHSSTLGPLREAVVASTNKTQLLEKRLEEERTHRETMDRKMRQLRGEHEERTAELDTTSRKLKEAEELAESHAAEARSHREAMLSGLDKISARDLENTGMDVSDERVTILQGQVENANAMVRDSQAAVETASDKLRRAEERIAGLEAYQEQASREGLTIRKQLQQAMKETQTLQAENTDLKQQLSSHQLESNAIAVQHGALKDLLAERGISPSDARARNNQSPGSFGGSDQVRLRELEQQLENAFQAHRETQSSFEIREQEADKAYREKLEQLEVDYQSAVHYVKGTEKMLKRMKDELAKYKTQNAQLQAELEGSQQGASSRSLDQEAPAAWEQERQMLQGEVESLHANVKESVTVLEKQMTDVRAELQAAQEERDQYREQSAKAENEYKSAMQHSRADLDQLQRENALLETRAADAETKVTYLLSQVETSVDNYRRQSRQMEPNGVMGHHHRTSSGVPSMSGESMYGGPDNRNSVALDSLASELDMLRSQWETTNKNYRLSNTFDFEKAPTSASTEGGGGDLSGSLTSWRKKLEQNEQQQQQHPQDVKRLSVTTENESTPTKGQFGTGAIGNDERSPNML